MPSEHTAPRLKWSVPFALAIVATTLTAQEAVPLTAQAKALVGVEYAGGQIGKLKPSCVDEGGSALTADGKVLDGWYYANVFCQRKPFLVLQKSMGFTDNLPRWRIVDAVVMPAYQHDDRPSGPGTLWFSETGLCTLDGKLDKHIVALVREGKQPKRVGERYEVARSWGFDIQREKIVPVSTKRVRCVHDEP